MNEIKKVLGDNVSGADNQQETLQNFYYTGFCCGEMSCSVIRQTRPYGSGFSYHPDMTISNADLELLEEIRNNLTAGKGIISPIKGGYNLSIRGKRRVKRVLSFFEIYPVLVGNIANTKLDLLSKAVRILSQKGRSTRRIDGEVEEIEKIRSQLRSLKLSGTLARYSKQINNKDAVGYFLAGVFDAEGSVGMKQSASQQPFFAVAMKDKEIIRLFHDFLRIGNMRYRKDEVYHFEIGAKMEALLALDIFLNRYPSRLKKMRTKMYKLQRILRDYTPGSPNRRYDIVRAAWRHAESGGNIRPP